MREELLVLAGKTFRNHLIALMKAQAPDGRVPGQAPMEPDEQVSTFRQMPPDYFEQLAVENPRLARQRVREFERMERRRGDAG
jgi:hypothetical protein